MAILKDLALVLRTYEQGNTSLVAVMLGRRLGQFRVHIKGGRRWPRKGFEGGFDLLARGEMLVYPRAGDNLWLFKEWDEHARPAAGQSVAMLRSAGYLCELGEALTRHTAGSVRDELVGPDVHGLRAGIRTATIQNPKSKIQNPAGVLYDWLASTADALAAGARPGPLLLTFTTRALQIEGLFPELHVCAECRSPLPKPRWAGLSVPPRDRSVPPTAPSPRPQAVWLTAAGLYCPECAARETAHGQPTTGLPVARAERVWHGQPCRRLPVAGAWLSPEAHLVLTHMHKTARPVAASVGAARQLARALVLLVHGALEHDLRTLPWAAQMVTSQR